MRTSALKIMVLFVITLFALRVNSSLIYAQENDICANTVQQRLESVAQACADAEAGLCAAADGLSVRVTDGEQELMGGEVVALADIEQVQTSADADVALIRASLNLPDSLVDMLLFGHATLARAGEAPESELVLLQLTNVAGYPVNLREGPGTQFSTAGVLDEDTPVPTDARSEDGAWLRIMTADGPAWVSASLVQVDGDLMTLNVGGDPIMAPMQAITLTTEADPDCGASASGLLLSHDSETTAMMVVNGVQIRMAAGSLLLQSDAEAELSVKVLSGAVDVLAGDQTVTATAGQVVVTALVADGDALVPGMPELVAAYAFADVVYAPLVDGCLVGLVEGDDPVSSYAQPGDDEPVAELNAASHYRVSAYATDEDDQRWWQLDDDTWVPQSAVRQAGACDQVAEAAPAQPAAAGGAATGSLVPASQAVYEAQSGPDTLTGNCEGVMPRSICFHPAAIIPNSDGTIYWRGQEPTPYLMTPAGTNFFVHNGRNFQNTGNIRIELTLISPETWTMSFATVFDATPACTQTFYYTGTRKW